MYNLQPGQGLGFGSEKEVALGLGTPFAPEVEVIFASPRAGIYPYRPEYPFERYDPFERYVPPRTYRYVGTGDLGYFDGEAEYSFEPAPALEYKFVSDNVLPFTIEGEADVSVFAKCIDYSYEASLEFVGICGSATTEFYSPQRKDDEDLAALIASGIFD